MENKNSVNLDDVLSKFSIFGRYHLKVMVLMILAYASNIQLSANYIFAVTESGYRCNDTVFGNDTSTCSGVNSSSCSEWVYDDPRSFVAEFQIACEEWKRTFVGTVHSFGYMVGLLFVGPLSDKIGRKNTLILTGVAGGVLGLARSFTTWYWLYIALEFLESAIGDSCSPVYILNIEIVATKKRVIYYNLCAIGYVVGATLLPLAAWSVSYWRYFLRVIYTPALLFLFYKYLVDESPRWLLTKGKKDKAITILKKIADTNKVKLDHGVLDKLEVAEQEKKVDLLSLLKITFASHALLKRFLICLVWWTTSTFVSYGLMINSVSLQGNKYLNYALVSIIDLPGSFILMYILSKFNRRSPLIASFLCGAVLCFAQPFLPTHLPWLSVIVYMISKVMCSFYFGITYLYTSELFPTYTRNSMHALCSSLGRIGSIVAPQTPLLMTYWVGLPSIVFGSMSLIAGAITFLAPDSADNSLPDTVRQAEALGAKEKGVDNIALTPDLRSRTSEKPVVKGFDNLAMNQDESKEKTKHDETKHDI